MALVGRLMATAAALREESRGTHYRTDYPADVESWRRRLLLLPNGGWYLMGAAVDGRAVAR